MNEESKLTITAQLPENPFEVMDRLDDEIIAQEMEGRIVDAWVYHFSEGGKEQWGLSKVGVDAACAELAKKGEVIRELELVYNIDPVNKEYVVFVSKAGRYAVSKDGREILLDVAIGTKRQWVNMLSRTGQISENKFYFEQGAMKALRNARSRLLSEEIKSKIIAFAKEKNKTKEVLQPAPVQSQTTSATLNRCQKHNQPLHILSNGINGHIWDNKREGTVLYCDGSGKWAEYDVAA